MKITLPDHAIAGVTPGYQNIEVIDLHDGAVLENVVEANVKEGWIVFLVLDKAGHPVRRPDGAGAVTGRETGSYAFRWAA